MKMNKKTSTLKRLLPFFSTEKKRLLWGSVAAVFITGTHLARPLILRQIIDTAIPEHNIKLALYFALAFVLALCTGALVQYFQILNLAKLGLNIVTKIKNKVFGHILKQDISFFDKNAPGRLMARTESDIEKLKVIFSHSAMIMIQSSMMLAGILSIIIYEEPFFGLILIFIFPFIAVAVYFYLNYIMKLWREVRKKNSYLSGYITEYVQAVPIIQLFSKKKKAMDKLLNHSYDKMKYEKKGLFVDYMVFWSFFHFLTETVSIAAIFYYGITKIIEGEMTIGSLIMYAELMRQLFMPLRNLMMVLSQVQSSLAAASRVFDILDTPSKVKNNVENNEVPHLREKLQFKNIEFAYDKETVINNMSFNIKAGEHVAIIGPSGSGKTTIINILLRFYELRRGEILIDNRNIKDYKIQNLRKDIGLVLQDVYLFPGTILQNLKSFNDEISDEQVFKAAKELGAHDMIMKKSDGYDTYLAESGANLSMGERQLVSFTRALVKNPDILILDEATSSVDVITENLLQNALKKLLEGRTAIIIAHRLSTIKEADKIFVFNEGEIQETGTHNELMEKRGLYHKLYKIQMV
ncbi:MAG: ABC transporter ATP-binding protein [Candidatus Muiribacteriota bacterium]